MKPVSDLRKAKRLKPEEVRWSPDPRLIPLTTKTVKTLGNEIVGQERGVAGITFGAQLKKNDYHIVVIGESGTGRKTTIRKKLAELTVKEKHAPDDYCYVHDPDNIKKLKLVRLKAGLGAKLKKDMDELISELKKGVSQSFGSEEYFAQIQEIQNPIDEKIAGLFTELADRATALGFKIKKEAAEIESNSISLSYGIIPVVNGEEKNFDALEELLKSGQLKKKEYDRILTNQTKVSDELQKTLIAAYKLEAEKVRLTQNSDKEYFLSIAKKIFPFQDYKKETDALKFVKQALKDMGDKVLELFFKKADPEDGHPSRELEAEKFLKYRVYPVTDNKGRAHPPVVFEDNLAFLFGRIISHTNAETMTTTELTIPGGSALKANGGYLVLNLRDFLREDINLWEKFMRLLKTGKLYLENYSSSPLIPAPGFKAEAIDINLKVVLIADHEAFEIIDHYDENFSEVFRVVALFDDEMENNDANIVKMVRFIKTVVAREKLLHFQKDAIIRVIEESARLSDQRQLSARFAEINDLLIQSDFWARKENAPLISATHIEQAIAQKKYRLGLAEDHYRAYIRNGLIIIDIKGAKVGQINGLAVLGSINSFGTPLRITVKSGIGAEGVINIEREGNLSGDNHNKGVAIIAGFLRDRFAQKNVLAMDASIAFEQNYSILDGDSASSAEIYALLSCLSGLPINQSVAVTGSVNQNGEIQAIGGVNEKIEGFFDCCLATGGLTGEQGVMIPATDKLDLMLRADVVAAIRENKFHIYAVSTIEEGVEILTGVKAWENPDNYGRKTVYGLVLKKLKEYAAIYCGETDKTCSRRR